MRISQEIDAIIKKTEGWRGEKLLEFHKMISHADPNLVDKVKWEKPSKPEGALVWSQNGILCVADILKNAVRLTNLKRAM